ncbi:MAG TPA: SPOR domain-containing protein [bacterium]|jgi:DedD protein
MRNLRWAVVLLAFALPLFAAKSALDLMLEGRFGEARQLIEKSNLSPRYELLYFAMTEADAARACSLYQVIAIRYPGSDCDSVSRERLDQARTMGFTVVPIAEWAQAPAAATPLFSQRAAVAEPVTPATPGNVAPPSPVVAAPEPVKRDSVPEPKAPEVAEVKTPEAAEVKPPEQAATPAAKEEAPATEQVPVVSDQPAPVSAPVPVPERETIASTSVQPLKENLQPHDKPVEPAAGHWFVQVGAFANFDNAHKLSLALQQAGYSVKLVPLEGKTKLLQVRVGGYMKRAELKAVMAQLKQQFSVPTAVVNE